MFTAWPDCFGPDGQDTVTFLRRLGLTRWNASLSPDPAEAKQEGSTHDPFAGNATSARFGDKFLF